MAKLFALSPSASSSAGGVPLAEALISEASDFAGATWQAYGDAMPFTISAGDSQWAATAAAPAAAATTPSPLDSAGISSTPSGSGPADASSETAGGTPDVAAMRGRAGVGGDPKVFPRKAAAWICSAIRYFKEEVPNPSKHTLNNFVWWVADMLDDAWFGPPLHEFVEKAGAWRPGAVGHVDIPTLRAHVGEYLKSFGGSLPDNVRLRDDGPLPKKRSAGSAPRPPF